MRDTMPPPPPAPIPTGGSRVPACVLRGGEDISLSSSTGSTTQAHARAQGTARTAAAGQRQDQKHGSIIRSTSGIGIIGIIGIS